ncbi:MarR family transcriptional regulator [Oceanobacillus sojae]|uniref:MarR family transcriptional regulator n=1 Tax=Oceanobacillus sojae TaxID=582851 RepID=UPI0009888302|nr:MarR family transcriptional regulator [Oceanobacillus sojae]
MNKEEQLITNFRDLFNKMVWINKYKMEDRLKGHTPSEVHCIESIEKNVDSNVRELAKSLYMTRGAISKLTKKLMTKKLIESYQKPDNKKEIYFKLTPQGKEIFRIHEDLHKEFRERDKVIFEQITDEQFEGVLHFVEKYSSHLDEEIKKQGLTIN